METCKILECIEFPFFPTKRWGTEVQPQTCITIRVGEIPLSIRKVPVETQPKIPFMSVEFIQRGIIQSCQKFRLHALSFGVLDGKAPFFGLTGMQLVTEGFPLQCQFFFRIRQDYIFPELVADSIPDVHQNDADAILVFRFIVIMKMLQSFVRHDTFTLQLPSAAKDIIKDKGVSNSLRNKI